MGCFESTSSFKSNHSKFIDCDVMRIETKKGLWVHFLPDALLAPGNPSHQLPPARFISCNTSNHPQIQFPTTTPRLPILSKPTVSTNCCWMPIRAITTTTPPLQSSATKQGSPATTKRLPFTLTVRAPPLHCHSRNGVGRMLNTNFCPGLHFV